MSTTPQTTLQQVLQIANLAATLEPVALSLVQAFMTKVQGMTPEQITAAADAIYAQIGATAQAELDKLGGK